MTFLSKLRSALGLEADNCQDLENYPAADSPKDNRSAVAVPAAQVFKDVDAKIFDEKSDRRQFENAKNEIFRSVVEIFNSNLPEFLRQSVDIARQEQYIYDSLDSSIREYLTTLELRAIELCEHKYKARCESLQEETRELKDQSRKVEEQKRKMQEGRMSADRQKRALQERVAELEKALENIEVEREQLDLENKSLLNKLRLSNMAGGNEEAPEQLETLKAELDLQLSAVNEKDEELKLKDSQLLAGEQELAKARGYIRDLEGLRSQYEQVIEAMDKRDELIVKLKNKNRELSNTIEELKQNQTVPAAEKTVSFKEQEVPAPKVAESFQPKITDSDLRDVISDFNPTFHKEEKYRDTPKKKSTRSFRRRDSQDSMCLQLSLF